MSEKIEFEVTASMCDAYKNTVFGDDQPTAKGIAAALAHPSFQSQLRAYVAGEARRLLGKEMVPEFPIKNVRIRAAGYNDCHATTLANIAAYEKEQEDGK